MILKEAAGRMKAEGEGVRDFFLAVATERGEEDEAGCMTFDTCW